MGTLLRARLARWRHATLVEKLGAKAQHLAVGRDGQHVVAEIPHAVAVRTRPETKTFALHPATVVAVTGRDTIVPGWHRCQMKCI